MRTWGLKHGNIAYIVGINNNMKTKKQIDRIWANNPFAIMWRLKNDIIAIKRMWIKVLKTNNK